MEAEYVVMSLGVRENMWLEMLFKELDLMQYFSGSELYSDNKAAIDFSKNKIDKDQHIDLCYHIVREKTDDGLIKLPNMSQRTKIQQIS